MRFCQWYEIDDKYKPMGPTILRLPPAVYEITTDDPDRLTRIPMSTEGLIDFPGSGWSDAVEEIKRFWASRPLYRQHNLAFKRGVLLWGPQGTGKSCAVRLIVRDVMALGGVAVKWSRPQYLMPMLRLFRVIQPDTPLVMLMEDVDAIVHQDESNVLNVLDGVEAIDGIVFLATTNFPELIHERVLNRPSRFDRRIFVDTLNADGRAIYLRHLIGDTGVEISIDRWVADTKGFSVAHLKELFTSVVFFKKPYNNVLARLREMGVRISSEEGNHKVVGFTMDDLEPVAMLNGGRS